MTGPTPASDREYLIQIFDRVNALGDDYKKSCDNIFNRLEDHAQQLKDHDMRISDLEKFDSAQISFSKGEEKWWSTYKEFVMAMVSIAAGILLALVGIK